VTRIPKDLSESDVRRKFAIFGRISSFKLVNEESYTTNIAYVAFCSSSHALSAF
jgi:RNA recognition motif-containing protein